VAKPLGGVGERGADLDPREHAQDPVECASSGDRIQVRSESNRLSGGIGSRKDAYEIAYLILSYGEPSVLEVLTGEAGCSLVCGTIAEAREASRGVLPDLPDCS